MTNNEYEEIREDVLAWIERRLPAGRIGETILTYVDKTVKLTLNRVSDQLGDLSPFFDAPRNF